MGHSEESPNQGSDDGLVEVAAPSVEVPPPRSSERRPRRTADPDDPRDAEVIYERAVASSAATELAQTSRK